MKLNVFVDNNTFIDMYYLGEPAVSYYIEDEGEKILFDTGYSDVFIRNANKMDIDLDGIDKIVISHGHNDHTGGLAYFKGQNRDLELIAHPDCFCFREDPYGLEIGAPVDKETLDKNYKLTLTDKPYQVSKNITFLGEIPELNDFEKRYAIGNKVINGLKDADYIRDDSAIVYKSPKGLFVITGCSHSGICNIIEYASEVMNEDKIYGVIGGFHLFDCDERLDKTVEYLESKNIELLYPCHCVSLAAKIMMSKKLNIRETGVGLRLEI